MARRIVVWAGTDAWRAEEARMELTDGGVRQAVGVDLELARRVAQA